MLLRKLRVIAKRYLKCSLLVLNVLIPMCYRLNHILLTGHTYDVFKFQLIQFKKRRFTVYCCFDQNSLLLGYYA